jgi:hypothetical protein
MNFCVSGHDHHDPCHDDASEFQVSQGLSTKVAESRLETLGPNEVPFRPEPFWKSIVEEMFTLFKVYQILIYSIWLWFAYLFVGALLFSIVLIAAAITIFNRRRSQFAIAKVRHRSMQIPQEVPHVDLCLMRHRDMQIQQVPHVELCLMRHTERDRVVYTCGLYAVDSVRKWCGCEARWCMDKSRLSYARPWWSCKSEEQLEPSMRSSHHSRCSLTHASLQFSIKLCVQKVYGHSVSSCSVCSEHLLKNDDMGFVLPSWIEYCCWSCWHDW